MTRELKADWQERQAEAIGLRVKALREASGMRAQSVADICTHELGYKMHRTSLNNLEAGLRKSVSVAEIAAIATAIGAAPLSLLIDPTSPKDVEIVGGTTVSSWEAWQWWNGEKRIEIVDGVDNELASNVHKRVRLMRQIDGQLRLYYRQVERGHVDYSLESAMMIVLQLGELKELGVPREVPDEIRELGEARLLEIRQRGGDVYE